MAIAPTITVVIPVKNEAANLPDVFATLPDWIDEVVLVDGRSQDDTIAVARQHWPDVKVVHQGGVGKGDALAAGFAAASGDIIVAIDGDGNIVVVGLQPDVQREAHIGIVINDEDLWLTILLYVFHV